MNAGWDTSTAPNSWGASNGLVIPGLNGDDACAEQSLNFNLTFDGQSFDRAQVSTNGYLQLKTASEPSDCTAPSPDLVTTTRRIVAVCAADLTISADPLFQGVYVTLGNASTGEPTRIRWKGYRKGTFNPAYCEVLLYPTTNKIEFRYGASLGAGPRVGVTPGDGLDFVAVAGYDRTGVPSNAANVTLTPAAESVQQSLAYNALDQLAADPASYVSAVTHNSDGDQTAITAGAREPVSFGFDARHLVVSQTVSKTPSLVTTWSIDGQSRVVTQTKTGQTTRYRYLGSSDSPIWEENSSGTVTTSFVSGPAGLLATYADGTGGTPAFPVLNGHGDVIQTRNASGGLVETYVYDENGSLTSAQTPTRYGYVGRWQKDREEDSGFIRMGVRMYDPLVSRFASWDPVEGGDLNAHTYAGGNACNGYDHSGTMNTAYDGGSTDLQALVDEVIRRAFGKGCPAWSRKISSYIGFFGDGGLPSEASAHVSGAATILKKALKQGSKTVLKGALKAVAGLFSFGGSTILATGFNVGCRSSRPRPRR
ncbi:MAG: RHS repeat-associated core domain-containing protein [Actinomycetota bacterium]